MGTNLNVYAGNFPIEEADNLILMLQSHDLDTVALALEILNGDRLVHKYQIKELRKVLKALEVVWRLSNVWKDIPEIRVVWAEVEDRYHPDMLTRAKFVKRRKHARISEDSQGRVGDEPEDAESARCKHSEYGFDHAV